MSQPFFEDNGQGSQEQNESNSNEDFSTDYSESTANESQEQTGNINPAWQDMLSAVPEEFHSHLVKGLTEWDKGVQKRFETVQQKFSPYKEFAELNVPATDISQALQLFQAINTQPKSVYDYLGEQFNFGQVQSQGQQEAEPEDYDLSQEVDITKNPQFVEMAEKASRAEQFMQDLQRREQQQQVDMQVQNEANQVLQKYPNIDMQAVATIAVGRAKGANEMPNLMQAAEYLQSLIPQQRVSDSAPPIITGGNRGIPQSQTPDFGKMTSDQRTKYVTDAMNAMAQANS